MRYWVHADTFDVGDLKGKATKVLEEASEACEEARSWGRLQVDGHERRHALRRSAITECCDVIQAALNLASALGATQAELDHAMEDVRLANEERGRYR